MKPLILCEAPRACYRPILLEEGERYVQPEPREVDVSYFTHNASAVVCMWSGESRWRPSGLAKVKCPKILMIGDTHHGIEPLTRTVRMAVNEPWDMICLEFNRQHCHWFAEAGAKNVQWLPCWHITPYDVEPQPVKKYDVGMIGGFGCHPYRIRVVQALRDAGINVLAKSIPSEFASQIYNQSKVALNVSLNGDFNLRNFEILAAGGNLLSDRLSEYSGWKFHPGQTFDSPSDCVEKCRAMLAMQPGETSEEVWWRWYWTLHSPERKIEAFWRCLAGETTWEDDRIGRTNGDIWTRIERYEEAQEMRRRGLSFQSDSLDMADLLPAPFTVENEETALAIEQEKRRKRSPIVDMSPEMI